MYILYLYNFYKNFWGLQKTHVTTKRLVPLRTLSTVLKVVLAGCLKSPLGECVVGGEGGGQDRRHNKRQNVQAVQQDLRHWTLYKK